MNNIDQNKNSVLPEAFKALVTEALPFYAEELLNSIQNHHPSLSIRCHPAKNVTIQWPAEQVKWCSQGWYLSERPSFTLDPMWHAGAYYVQEASSMVLCSVLPQLKLPENPIVLDLCAAPGGKSTLLLDFLGERGHLVANEVIKPRAGVLMDNLIKWGYSNVVVTNNDPSHFLSAGSHFDLILVDAPCSGEGMFRKDAEAIGEWSVDNVSLCSARQQRIIDDIVPSLHNNGYIIYSTCTFNEEENIKNVIRFAEKYQLTSIPLHLDAEWNIIELKSSGVIGYQCIPGITKGEGYFFAVLQKQSDEQNTDRKTGKLNKLRPLNRAEKTMLESWVTDEYLHQLHIHENGDVYYFSSHLLPHLSTYLKELHVKYAGVKLGKVNKTIFTPEHSAATSFLPLIKMPSIELTREDALRFLNKSLPIVNSTKRGWAKVTYQNLGLGWIKNLGNRINNYLPAHLRITMDIGIK